MLRQWTLLSVSAASVSAAAASSRSMVARSGAAASGAQLRLGAVLGVRHSGEDFLQHLLWVGVELRVGGAPQEGTQVIESHKRLFKSSPVFGVSQQVDQEGRNLQDLLDVDKIG